MIISVLKDGSAPAPLPQDEDARLEALRSYLVLDTPVDPAFDRITQLASRLCNAPIALLSLIAEDRQWFKSTVGLEDCEMPRNWSFCSHAILEDGSAPMVVCDTHLDARFETNPLTVGLPYIRFYAGAPLIASGGHKLGTLCVIDTRPRRHFDNEQAEVLQLLAALAVDLLEFHKVKTTYRL